MFNGERLSELRILKGYSRQDLAEKLSISEQAVWQYENDNDVKPKTSTLLSICRLFGVEVNYFEIEATSNFIDKRAIAFRNGDLNSKKLIQIQAIYLNKVHQLFSYLDQFVESPNLSFYSLVDKINEKYGQPSKWESRGIEEVADLSRKMLGLDNDNSNLLYQIEVSGINVLSRLLNKESSADAYSLWTRDEVPYIVLGKGKSAVRRNFDLAHELGHLILHKFADFEDLDKSEKALKENEANIFASYLLMPEDNFKLDFERLVGSKTSNPLNYVDLKLKYNVSIQALEYRAYKLGYLTPAQNSYFYRLIAKYDYKKVEPLDLDLPLYKPGKIRAMLKMILSNNLVDLQSILRSQRVTRQFISQLLDLEDGFFNEFGTTNGDYNSIIKIGDYIKKA